MIYIDRIGKREVLRCYLMYADGFSIEWRQSVNSKEEIAGIGTFNQNKIRHIYRYKKKRYGAMYKRILGLSTKKPKSF